MILTFSKNTQFLFVTLTILICFSCGSQNEKSTENRKEVVEKKEVISVGANQFEKYFNLLKGKKVGLVANQTSMIVDSLTTFFENPMIRTEEELLETYHIVDFLLGFNLNIVKVFAPEHGFRGKADAGELVKDGMDTKTGLPIISLYGKNKKPSSEHLNEIEIMVFDIQDVGARFYTYISTLHYIMEACAEQNIPLLILDRPNPNGHYIDGPILEAQHKSFVGMHPVPVVHGMTIGEYAQMINGEGWLANGITCELNIVKIKNYTHQSEYSLPVKPSPNLPNDISINLYPSLCFFEGTPLSAGRGTTMQFQVFGSPNLSSDYYPFTFTPQANEGSKFPKFKNKLCYGKDLRTTKKLNNINLEWLIEAYISSEKKSDFFLPFFTKLAGTTKLQEQIEKGYTFQEIRNSWRKDLEKYEVLRTKYLLYE